MYWHSSGIDFAKIGANIG